MTTKRILLGVAPTGGWGLGRGNPIIPEAVAEAVLACEEAGASLTHHHARDENGRLTADLSCFNRTLDALRASSEILIEASTGGLSDLTAAERALPVGHPHADLASLNMGSLNFEDQVYCNPLPDIRFWIRTMADAGVKPTLEVFEVGHLDTTLRLIDQGLLERPCNFSFVFDVAWGMRYHPRLLDLLISKLPPGSHWGAVFVESKDFSGHLEAADKGASFVRVGFEDSRTYDGKTASNNAELVADLRRRLEDEGHAVASVREARRDLLG